MSRSGLKQPRSCNLFRALFCCLHPQDGPKLPPLPPSQQALLESVENGTVVKVTLFFCVQPSRPLQMCVLLEGGGLGPTNTIYNAAAPARSTREETSHPEPLRACARGNGALLPPPPGVYRP